MLVSSAQCVCALLGSAGGVEAVGIRDKEGYTALHLAHMAGHEELVRELSATRPPIATLPSIVLHVSFLDHCASVLVNLDN